MDTEKNGRGGVAMRALAKLPCSLCLCTMTSAVNDHQRSGADPLRPRASLPPHHSAAWTEVEPQLFNCRMGRIVRLSHRAAAAIDRRTAYKGLCNLQSTIQEQERKTVRSEFPSQINTRDCANWVKTARRACLQICKNEAKTTHCISPLVKSKRDGEYKAPRMRPDVDSVPHKWWL